MGRTQKVLFGILKNRSMLKLYWAIVQPHPSSDEEHVLLNISIIHVK